MSLHERLRAYRSELDTAIDEQAEADAHVVVTPAPPRDRSRVVTAAAVVAVVAMVASAIVGIIRHSDRNSGRTLTVEALLHGPVDHRVQIVTTITAGPQYPRTVTTGVYDFDRNIARVQETLAGGATDESGETLVVHGKVYSRIDAKTARGLPPRVRSRARWTVDRNAGALGANGLFDPFTTFADLSRRATALRDLGPTHVDGQRVEHYVAIGVRTAATTVAPTGGRRIGSAKYDLYVARDRRLVRLVMSFPSVPSFGRFSEQFDFSDYGVAVDVVAPPADQVVDYDDANVEFVPPKLTGPWARVATGVTSGYAWKLFRAPADHERACWSFETAAPGLIVANTSGSIGRVGGPPEQLLEHEGHATTCSRTGIWASPLQYVFAAVDSTLLRLLEVGIVDDDVIGVDRISKSSTAKIGIDPRFHGFVSVGGFEDPLRLQLRSGRTIDCDPSGARGNGGAPTCPSLND